MKTPHFISGLKTFSLIFSLSCLVIMLETKANEVVEGEFIVKFREGIGSDSALASVGGKRLQYFPTIGAQLWQIKEEGNNRKSIRRKLSRLRNNPRIEYVEPNYIIKMDQAPNDPYFPDKMWALNKIYAVEAWAIHQSKTKVIIAIIDTGVDYNHPDLAPNMWINIGEIPGNQIDDDKNGYIDDVYGYDFLNGTSDPIDDNFHGTHCAGIIAALANNGIGIAGVTSSAQIMALKFQDAGYGTMAAAISAIEYARGMGAKIINASWGWEAKGQALKEAIEKAKEEGILMIASAGNRQEDIDERPHYPASYNLDNIISVAATAPNDELAQFDFGGSNYGHNSVDLGAPGLNIYSTVPKTIDSFECSYQGCYTARSGTSMATPYVTGVAALLWSFQPELTYQQVKAKIISSVDKIPGLEKKTVTGGRLNAYKALIPNEGLPQAICTTSVNGLRATLEATQSDEIKSYNWTIYREQTEEQSGAKITVDFEKAGFYPVILTLQSQTGFTDSTECIVKIPEENVPRVAQVKAFITPSVTQGMAPLTVYFDATRSVGQPRGGKISISDSGVVETIPITQYSWEICKEVSGSGCIDIDSKNEAQFFKIFQEVGTYVINLTITDEERVTDTTKLKVNVTESWPLLPELGWGQMIGSDAITIAAFAGGISLKNEGDYKTPLVERNLAHFVIEVLGEITVDPRHVGKTADLFVVIMLTPLANTPSLLMLDSQGIPHSWELDLSELKAFQAQVILKSTQRLRIIDHKGPLHPGSYEFFFGYRLQNGTLIFNQQPITLIINP